MKKNLFWLGITKCFPVIFLLLGVLPFAQSVTHGDSILWPNRFYVPNNGQYCIFYEHGGATRGRLQPYQLCIIPTSLIDAFAAQRPNYFVRSLSEGNVPISRNYRAGGSISHLINFLKEQNWHDHDPKIHFFPSLQGITQSPLNPSLPYLALPAMEQTLALGKGSARLSAAEAADLRPTLCREGLRRKKCRLFYAFNIDRGKYEPFFQSLDSVNRTFYNLGSRRRHQPISPKSAGLMPLSYLHQLFAANPEWMDVIPAIPPAPGNIQAWPDMNAMYDDLVQRGIIIDPTSDNEGDDMQAAVEANDWVNSHNQGLGVARMHSASPDPFADSDDDDRPRSFKRLKRYKP